MKKALNQDCIAAGLGLAGFAGTYLSFSFSIDGIPHGVVWSAVFPVLSVLAYGKRGAVISLAAGLYGLYPFVLYSISGNGNFVTLAATAMFLLVHGWAAEKRKGGSTRLLHRMPILQGLYTVGVMPLYLIGFQLLTSSLFDTSVVFWFALKEGVNGFIALASAEALLTLPCLRRFLDMDTDETYAQNALIMGRVIGAGIVFFALLVFAEYYLLSGSRGMELWDHPLSDRLFVSWLSVTFLLILGGKAAVMNQARLASANQVLAERNRFRDIFENIEDVYYETDLEGITLEMSPSSERVLGLPREKAIGRMAHRSELLKEKFRREGNLHNDVVEIPDDEGYSRFLSVNAKLVHKEDGTPKVLGIVRDITELEVSRRQLQEMNAALENRVRARTLELEHSLQELENFAHTVSHDLKSPTRSIESYCQFILEDYPDRLPEDVKEMLCSIQAICGEMLYFIHRLLEYAMVSKRTVEPVLFSTRDVIARAVQEHKGSLAGRDMVIEVSDSLPDVWGDPMLFRQIMANGLSNAVKFTASRPQGHIRIEATQEGNRARFSLADNGIGFDPAQGERLFEIFYRLHMTDSYEGAGIGLATVRKCAERMGGSVWMTGAPDAGAVLWVELPMTAEEVNADV